MESSDNKTDKNIERPSTTPDFSDQERELSHNALVDFESGQYQSSLGHLSKLEDLRPKDVKVWHNKAVAEFYKSGCTRTEEILKSLQTIKKKMNHKNDDVKVNEITDVDKAVLFYNKAVYCYYVKKYNEAASILDKFLKHLDSLDQTLAQNMCFLLVDVYLTLYQTEKAAPVLILLEKLLNDTTNQSSENDDGKKQEEQETETSSKLDEQQKHRLHKLKARLNLLQKSIKACKKEIKNIMNTNSMDYEGVFIKSNFEFIRHNERKAIKLLNSIERENNVQTSGESVTVMYLNNLGCLHAQIHKYNLASHYFCRAIEENEKAVSKFIPLDKSNPVGNRPLCALSLNCRYRLLYNLGVQILHDSRPLLAFDCLIESVQVYHSNPRLWLRLAECCIMAHQMSLVEGRSGGRQRKSDLVQCVAGSGPYRKVLLATEQYNPSNPSLSSHSAAMPACNLHFGLLCLKNALILIPEQSSKTKETAESQNNHDNGQQSSPSLCIPAAPSAPVKGEEIQQLRNSILVGSSYIALVLGDFVLALEHAQNLLAQPKLSGSLIFLGHMYCAEALINLGRIQDAIVHLSTDNIKNITTLNTNGETQTGSIHNFPQTVLEARATFLINLTSAYCLRGEFDKAKKCLYQATSLAPLKELPSQAVVLAIYIELQNGNSRGALEIIKKHQLLPPGKANEKNRKLRKTFTQ